MDYRRADANRQSSWLAVAVAWFLALVMYSSLIVYQVGIGDPVYRISLDQQERFQIDRR